MTRTSTTQLAEAARYEWLMERADAEEYRCPTCRAAPAVTCRNIHTGRPLQGQPAHAARVALTAVAVPSPRRPSAGGPGRPLRRGRCSRAVWR